MFRKLAGVLIVLAGCLSAAAVLRSSPVAASATDCKSYGYACTPGYDATNTEGTWAWKYYGGSWALNANGYHNCTLYAAWRLEQNGMADPGRSWGNAVDWIKHTSYNHTPAIGSIAWWGGGYGHVAYVDQISGSQVHIIADNYIGPHSDGYTDSGWIAASSVDEFLHPHDVTPSPPSNSPPSISLFRAIPGTLSEAGGQISLVAEAANATSYQFGSPQLRVQGLGTVDNSSGVASDTVQLPPLDAETPMTLSFTVTVTGPGGTTSANTYLELSQVETSQLVLASGTNSDYCRQVGSGPNNVSSFVACTAFNGTSFGPTVNSKQLDWGYTGTGVWVPTAKGADYCRQVGSGPNNVSSFVACTAFNGTSFGPTVNSKQLDWGYTGTGVWVPTAKGADYCRQVGSGPNNVSSFVACTAFNGTSFGPTVNSKQLDWGYTGTGVWVPTAKGADYCRQVGSGPNNVSSFVACTAFNGTSFGPTVNSKQLDWGYTGTGVWVPTAKGADYCRQVGSGPNNVSSFVACTAFNGTSFGPTVNSKQLDWGYTGTGVWVPTAKGADYCRQVGSGPNNVSSFVACTAFNGTSFGPTVNSKQLDWGYTGTGVWVPTAKGADYCRQVGSGPNNVSSFVACTAFNGTSFGPTVNSKQLDWGYTGTGVWAR